jgi:ribosomal protein S18 acetylase RimI-like enzyme
VALKKEYPIEVASIDDAKEIADLMNRAYARNPDHRNIHPREVEGWINRGGALLKMLSEERGIIGTQFLILDGGARVCHLSQLAVHPDLERGHGPDLIKAAEEYAYRNNCRGITFRLDEKKDGLIRLYSALGYSKTGNRFPTQGGIELEMRKAL